jgi:hypothetical protein
LEAKCLVHLAHQTNLWKDFWANYDLKTAMLGLRAVNGGFGILKVLRKSLSSKSVLHYQWQALYLIRGLLLYLSNVFEGVRCQDSA